MRPDPAAGDGVAHHDIVQPRIRQEAEAPQQRVRLRQLEIEPLHQKCPPGLRQARKLSARERPLLHVPGAAAAAYESRFDVVPQRQRKQFRRLHHALKVGNRIADQQRFFLPEL